MSTTVPASVTCAAKVGSYFNERGKFKNGEPMFSRDNLLPGDEVMVYSYDLNKHVKAIITGSIMPEELQFEQRHDKLPGSYSAKMAIKIVEGTDLPHVYLSK